jgi:hypothetical protein
MSSIQSIVKELEAIRNEIKRNNDINAKLRKRSVVLETHISGYLESKNQPGFKHNGKKFVLQEKTAFKRAKKKDKEESVTKILREMGVHDPKSAYERIQVAQKGEEVEVRKLKITNDTKK